MSDEDYNKRSSKSLEDIWDDELSGIESYDDAAAQQALKDFSASEGSEVIEEEKVSRRSARFDNVPKNDRQPDSDNGKWDKYKV